MLTQLQTIDDDLRQGIQELAALVSVPVPDEEALSRTRLKLARLNGRRRALIQCAILPHLHVAPSANAAQLADLRTEAATWSIRFSDHIARWTARAIRADWTGYQAASVEMRRSILKQIEREAAILYPLLGTQGGSAAA